MTLAQTIDGARIAVALRKWREHFPGTGRIEFYRDALNRDRARVSVVGVVLPGGHRIVAQTWRTTTIECEHGVRHETHARALTRRASPRWWAHCAKCDGFAVGDVIGGFRVIDVSLSPHSGHIDGHRRVRLRCTGCGRTKARRATLVRKMRLQKSTQCKGCGVRVEVRT